MDATRRHLTMAPATTTAGAVVGGRATSMRTGGAAERQSCAAADEVERDVRAWRNRTVR